MSEKNKGMGSATRTFVLPMEGAVAASPAKRMGLRVSLTVERQLQMIRQCDG